MSRLWSNGLKRAKKLITVVVGFTLLLIGLALIVLPGPAVVVLPVALAVLASEFAWARLWRRRVRKKLRKSPRPDEPRTETQGSKGGEAP